MLSKEQFLNSVIHELNICRHLHEKIPADKFDYRPLPGMKTTLELLKYLAVAPYEFAVAMLKDSFATGNWDSFNEADKQVDNMKPEEFPGAIDIQIEKFKKLFTDIEENDLIAREITPGWPPNNKLGAALIDHSLKVAAAYRMQLFIYVKLSAAPELHSGNCWFGSD